jgi:hypothetical protein
MSVAQRRIERNAWKRKGASHPVSTRAFKTHRTARAVPLQVAIANTTPDGLRRAASIPFTPCGRAPRNGTTHGSGRAQALRSPGANHYADAGKKVDLGTGIRPESLPPAEDVKKVERRLTSAEKKALENPDKLEGA